MCLIVFIISFNSYVNSDLEDDVTLFIILDVLAWLIVFSIAFVDLELYSVYSLPIQFLILGLSIASLVASKKLNKTLKVEA